MNILLTCAGRRNYLVNYFKEALNGNGKVIATDVQLNAPALVDADIPVKAPTIYEDDYIPFLLDVCKNHQVKALISLNDLELPLISNNKASFDQIGVSAIVSDPSVINICFDKWKTKQFLDSINVKAPKTYINLQEALNAIKEKELQFPLVIKPRWGSASIGVEFPESQEELELAYKLLALKLSKTILAEASNEDFDQAILIQEKLTGAEYGMDVLNDLDQQFVASFAKVKLAMRDGETDKAISVYDEKFNQIGEKLGRNLKHIGNLDVDVFDTEDGPYVLELNPRFGGGYPFTYEAGVNIPKILIEWLSGRKDIEPYLQFAPNKAFSKCDRMVAIPAIC